MQTRYDELEEIHETFVGALGRDPKPAAKTALFWHEAMRMQRDPAAPDAHTHGPQLAEYVQLPTALKDVPGQNFAEEKRPYGVCHQLIARNAPSWDGPRSITFRYDQNDNGNWEGGYSIETSAQYKELVLGRAGLDARMTAALQALWTPGLSVVGVMYGHQGWKEFGPKLRTIRARKAEFVALPEAVQRIWDEYVGYLRAQGVRHLYEADLTIRESDAVLREGDGVQLRYDR